MGKIYLLNNQKYEDVENLEVFKIEYIKSDIELNKYDALIITSKNAIYSLDSFNSSWKNIPCFAIASKTADVIKSRGGIVEFVGSSGHGNDFATEILEQIKNKKVLYIRAKKVVSNLVQILKDNSINIDELITYQTVCNNNLEMEIENNSTIVFTSPSSVDCFFKKYSWNDSLKAVVIGKTTAKSMPKDINYQLSSITSIEECLKLARINTF